MTRQIAVRIPDELARQIDELVASGRYATRADVVRAGLETIVEREQQRYIDQAIAEGYQRHPPTKVEKHWVQTAGQDMIAEEPW